MEEKEYKKQIWFTADLHLGHANMVDICSRPTSKWEHDQWLLDRINEKVNEWDDLYILGDIAWRWKYTQIIDFLSRMNGNKYFIPGNHDESLTKEWELNDLFCHLGVIFKRVDKIMDININNEEYKNLHIVLCHYPLASWNRRIHGSIHLYGHTHGSFENSGLSMDVGVDANNWYPVSLDEVMIKMSEKKLKLKE